MTDIISPRPLSLYFVGSGRDGDAITWEIADRVVDGSVWSFTSISIVERAVLRELCAEAIRRLDATEAREA